MAIQPLFQKRTERHSVVPTYLKLYYCALLGFYWRLRLKCPLTGSTAVIAKRATTVLPPPRLQHPHPCCPPHTPPLALPLRCQKRERKRGAMRRRNRDALHRDQEPPRTWQRTILLRSGNERSRKIRTANVGSDSKRPGRLSGTNCCTRNCPGRSHPQQSHEGPERARPP